MEYKIVKECKKDKKENDNNQNTIDKYKVSVGHIVFKSRIEINES